MNDILVHAFAERIRVGMMQVEQVPEVFRVEVQKRINAEGKAE